MKQKEKAMISLLLNAATDGLKPIKCRERKKEKMKELKIELEFEKGGLGFYKNPTLLPLNSFISYLVFDEYRRLLFICVVYDNDETQQYELYEMLPTNVEGRGIKGWDFERVKSFIDYLNEKKGKVNA